MESVPPYGAAQPAWYPQNRTLVPPVSTDSQDSFRSQMPLSYHLPSGGGEQDLKPDPQTGLPKSSNNMSVYQEPPRLTYHASNMNFIEHHSDQTGQTPGYMAINPAPTNQGDVGDYGQPPQMPQGYLYPQPYGGGPQMPAQYGQFAPGMMQNAPRNFQQPNVQNYYQHQQAGPVPQYSPYQHNGSMFPYQTHQYNGQPLPYQDHFVQPAIHGNQAIDRNDPSQLHDSRNGYQNQQYASPGLGVDGWDERQPYPSPNFEPRRTTRRKVNPPVGQNNRGQLQQRPRPFQRRELYYKEPNTQQNQPYPFVGLGIADYRQDQPSYLAGQGNYDYQLNQLPAYTIQGSIDHQQRLALLNAAINVGHPSDSTFEIIQTRLAAEIAAVEFGTNIKSKSQVTETPTRSSGGTTVKHSTPATAPALGRGTPVGQETATPALRSRRGQTISKIKIDPMRGPPPSFVPAGISLPDEPTSDPNSGASILNGSPEMRCGNPASDVAVVAAPVVDDPFIGDSAITSPFALHLPKPRRDSQASQSTVSKNPFGPIGPPASVGQITTVAPISLPQQPTNGPSRHMMEISPNGMMPSIETAFDVNNLPFVEMARQCGPANFGVVRITNIPYSVTRAEIVAFLGRNARIVNEVDEPVHIIMDRVTGKTLEAFIEFINTSEAIKAVHRYAQNRSGGRGGLLGERHVELEVSGQDRMMAELFPKAKNVKWAGARPEIIPNDPNDRFNTGFKGFVSREELVMIVKHVESPARSPFSRECVQRPFECLVSTLVKFPWYMVDYITLEEREILFDTSRTLTRNLVIRLQNATEDISINERLLRRLSRAIFRCPGFTETQKDEVAFICHTDTFTAGLAPYADHWFVFKALGPKPLVEVDVLLYYIALLREATTSADLVTLAERAAQETGNSLSAFGNITIDYPPNVSQCTLAQVARIEWNVLEKHLRSILLK